MKNKTAFLGILMLLGAFTVAQGQITGSLHDFSDSTWAPVENTMCGVCHTPHNASSDEAPLWNHSVTVTSFDLYTSATLDATITAPAASSKLCLSCHDGTVALDNFGGTTTGSNYIGSAYSLGSDLSDDHPINFEYTQALATADGGLFDPTTTSTGLGGTIAQDMLFDNIMQCASCHDVHNTDGYDHMLRIDNTDSELCLTCHNK